MIPMNPTVKLIIALVLVGAVGALQALFKVEPAWTWIGTIVQIATAAELYFTIPPMSADTVRRAAAKLPPLPVFLFVAALSFGTVGCGPASGPLWTQIEQTILTDVENGALLSTIEQAVIALDPALGGDVAAADAVIQAVIQFFESAGVLPTPASQSYGKSLLAEVSTKLAASKAGR